METFPFIYHTPTHVYPKGNAFKFGGGYEFSAAPQEPVQRRITLHFKTIVWYADDEGVLDDTTELATNAYALVKFYERHYTWKTFLYNHPVFGELKVKFAADAPFELPKSLEGGSGATEEFEIELIEQAL